MDVPVRSISLRYLDSVFRKLVELKEKSGASSWEEFFVWATIGKEDE